MTEPTFAITVTGIKTATINKLTGAIKQVDWTIQGDQDGQTFSLPYTTIIPDPDTQQFVPLDSITPEIVIAWIEQYDTRLEAIKLHIQMVLANLVEAAALHSMPLPWAPAVEPAVDPLAAPVVPPVEPVVPPPPLVVPPADPLVAP